MEDVPDASTQLNSTLQFYVDEFRQNQESFKAHLKGSSCNVPPLLPAFLPPSSYWTSAEKDLFFHALSVYSRLQPELVAQHVKTKSAFDVCVYLEALKRAVERMEEDEEQNEDSTENSLRAEMEPAMEVSEKWVLREEAIAESLLALDACPCSLERSNSKLVQKCTCPSPSERNPSGGLGGLGYPVPQKFDNLNHLDPTSLMALEMIHREGGTENYPDDAQPLAEERQRSTSALEPQAIPNSPHPPVEPVELASKDEQQMSNPSSRNPSPGPDKAQLRRIQKRIYMRRKRAEAVGKTANTETVKLRPGRLAKDRKPAKPRPKTYKPRKASGPDRKRMHASQNGREELEVSEDAQSSSRRSRSHQKDGSQDESTHERCTKGGLTRPYRLKKLFHESGITTQALSELELDLFNLTELGRLLRLNNSLNTPSRKGDDISISVECIQLLGEMIKRFSSKVVQRAIIMKEQEIRLKANLKVWKYDRQEISAENMLECLKTMGLDQLSKGQYFSDLLDENSDGEDSSEEMTMEEESTVSDEQSLFEDASAPESLQPLSNLIYCDTLSAGDTLSSDVDEVALTKELAEEDILDVLDIVQSQGYEKNLWRTHC